MNDGQEKSRVEQPKVLGQFSALGDHRKNAAMQELPSL